MPSDAPPIKRERVAADGAEIVIVGTASDERQRWPRSSPPNAGSRSSRRSTTIGSSPARGRSASSSSRTCRTSRSSSSRSVAAGWRAGSPWRSGRSARRRGSSASSPSSRPMRAIRWRVARSCAGRPSWCPGRRRWDEDAGARWADVRAPAGLSRFDRHRLRGRDRGRGPAGGGAEPARRRTIGRAGHRGDGVPRARSRAGSGDGPIVAVVSGGNVDPERYRDYLVAPIPPEG